jgi:nitroreductase
MLSFDDTVRARRAVRGFHPDRPVPPDVMRDAFALAQRAPSNCNIQPWRVFVASGAARERVRDALSSAFDEGVAGTPDVAFDTFRDEHRRLQVDCAVTMYKAMGIGKHDRSGRGRAHRRNFELFDAPHTAVVCMNRDFGAGVALDVGMYVQTLMLALAARGVQSCPQAAVRHYPAALRSALDIPEDLQVLCGMSFGYENPSVPANSARMTREPVEANVFFREK